MQAKAITRLDYCQYLLVSQNNYTLTHYAEHHPEEISHDRINRYLRDDKLTPKLVWEKVKQDILPDDEGILIFDESILDKNHSHKIELVNHQYSGNAHRIIKGICIV
ncbi:transposase, partial [Moraxella catarrhalis]|nr:transposase [Moraxella catarrhalis]